MSEKTAEYGCLIWSVMGAVGLIVVPFLVGITFPLMIVALIVSTVVGAITGILNAANSIDP